MAEAKEKPINGVEAFWKDFCEVWREIPDKGLFFALAVVWVALFHIRGNAVFGWVDTSSLFGWLYWIYDNNENDAHGMLIPFVVLVLLWWKREELLPLKKGIWWPALGLVVLGLVLHVLGFMVQQTRLSVVGFFTGLYGLTGLVWGLGWLRRTFFPMFLFAFCIPLDTMSEAITYPLRVLATFISVGIADYVLGIEVVRQGTMIFDPQMTFRYDVAAACSGIRSLVTVLALTTIYGFLVFDSIWKRILMVAIALPLAVLGNVVRLTAIIAVAEAMGHDAGAFVEQKLGFITFAVAFACVLLVGYLLGETRRRSEPLPGVS